MDDTNKMLHAIINGQCAMKSELLSEIRNLDKKLSTRIGHLESKMDAGFKNLTDRVDKIGLQVARLEDDTPTVEEFDKLKAKVDKYLAS